MMKTFATSVCLLALSLAASAAPVTPAATQPDGERVDFAATGAVTIYRPAAAPGSVVLFLSGDGGWNQGVIDMARVLVAQGALVVGVSVPEWQARLQRSTASCVSPDADLEQLSHFVQSHEKLPGYLTPYIVGYSSGASWGYALLAEAPVDTFAGAISIGFCPDIEMRKPICKGEGVHYTTRTDGKGIDLKPGATLRNPWVVLHGEVDQVCAFDTSREFVYATPDASLVSLAKVGHGYSVPANWSPQFLAAFRDMRAKRQAAALPPPANLAGLPIVEVAAQGAGGDYFAVMLSGDGGWAGMDKEIAAELSARGIPVAGWDSLRYFWSARTPEGLAADLDRVLRHYADRWHKSRAIFIGYSQGADVLSFAVNRLPETSRALLAESVMIAPGLAASFEFHVGNWLGGGGDGIPIPPEAAKLDAAHTLCIHGQEEDDSLCPRVDGKSARSVALPGGHHFNGDYKRVAAEILGVLRGAP